MDKPDPFRPVRDEELTLELEERAPLPPKRRVLPATASPPLDSPYAGVIEEERAQRRYLLWAPPLVFAIGTLLMWGGGAGFVRIVFGMWLHELGHAIAAWSTGHWAVPGPWATQIDPDRSIGVTLALLGATGAIGYRAWSAQKRSTMWAMGALALVIVLLTFGLSSAAAQAGITFFGDAGMMLLGAALVLTFWSSPGSRLHEGMLRWGFLAIGALGMLDGIFTWWPARSDPSVIPYGEIERVGLSDPTKLVDLSGWSQEQLIARYSWVIAVAVAMVLARWAYGVWAMRDELWPKGDDAS